MFAVLAVAGAPTSALARDRDRAPFPIPGEEPPVRADDAGPGLQEEVSNYIEGGREDEVILPGSPFGIRGLQLRASGNWRFGFFVSQSVVRDDNVDLTERDTRTDHEFTTMVGGRALREGASFATDITAAVGVQLSSKDGDRNFTEGHLRAGFAWDLRPGYLHFGLFGSSRESSTIQREETSAAGPVEIARGAPVRQNSHGIRLAIGRRPEPGGWEVRYQGSRDAYNRRLDELDATHHDLEGELRYALSPKLQGRLGAGARAVSYVESSHSDQEATTVFAGLHWQPTVKTTIEGRVGYLAQRSKRTSTLGDDRSFHGMFASIEGQWRPTPKTLLSGGYDRDLQPSLTGNFERVDRVAGAVSWDINPSWVAMAAARMQWSSPSLGEDSRLRSGELRLGWRVRRGMDAGVFVERAWRTTRSPGGDYTVNRVGVQVSFGF
jgi:hypothetical protein